MNKWTNWTMEWMAAAAMWTLGTTAMIAGSFRHSVIIIGWGGWVSLIAALVTAHILVVCAVRRERICIERLVDAVIERARQESQVPRIPTPRS